MAIRHSTPADNSFTPLGKIAWDAGHDGDSSDIAFVPSGTGAITTETVQAAGRRLTFSGQYGSAANFNTATDSLTDTLGISKVRFATQAVGNLTTLLRIPTADTTAGDFVVLLDDRSTYFGTRDNAFSWGYNLAAAQIQELANESAIGFTVENNYAPDGSGTSNLTEFHLQGAYPDGTSFRPWSFGFNRSSKVWTHEILSESVQWFERTRANASITLTTTTTTGTLALGVIASLNLTSIVQNVNNAQWLSQIKADNSGYIEIARINASNKVLLDPSGSGLISHSIHTFDDVLRAPNGSKAGPSYSGSGFTTSGMYFVTGALGFATAGTHILQMDGGNGEVRVGSGQCFGWSSNSDGGAANADTKMFRDAANTLALKNGNSAQAFRYYAGNGGFAAFVSFNELLTIAAAATTDSTTTIPAGAIILSASVRVTTVIPTAATFTVTAATGGTTLSTAAVSVAANSTDAGTAAGALYTAAGTKIRITPNLTPGAATGVVRIDGYYFLPTPPTS